MKCVKLINLRVHTVLANIPIKKISRYYYNLWSSSLLRNDNLIRDSKIRQIVPHIEHMIVSPFWKFFSSHKFYVNHRHFFGASFFAKSSLLRRNLSIICCYYCCACGAQISIYDRNCVKVNSLLLICEDFVSLFISV